MNAIAHREIIVPRKENLNYKFFPSYAKFLLKNKLDEFVKFQLRLARDMEYPLMKFFEFMSEEQLLELSKVSNTEFFEHVISNTLDEFIIKSLKRWVEGQLPLITREQVIAEDISLGSLMRKKAFVEFLPSYTKDIELMFLILGEIDDYLAVNETASFKTFTNIQHEELDRINSELQKNEVQLLEAQELAKMGSFEWNLNNDDSLYTPQLYNILELETASSFPDFLGFIDPLDRKKVETAINKALTGDGLYECEYRYAKNGKEKIIWSRGKVTFMDGRPSIMKGTIMDVTERHSIIQKLQQNEALYKQAQALTHIGNWSWQLKDNKILWSDEMYRIYGLEPQSEEITYERFVSTIHPDDREMRRQQIIQSIETHQAPDYTMRIILPGGEIKVLRGKNEVLLDSDGKPYIISGTCQDVTIEHNASIQLTELNQTLEQKNLELERSNKELTSFSYVASHDLKEPLRKIRTFSNIITESEENRLSDKGKELLQRINTSTAQMQKLIEDLLTFSRAHTYANKPSLVDLNEVLMDIKNSYEEQMNEKRPVIEFDSLPVINGISFQFHQMFENIISNSIKYAKVDVVPHIQVKCSIIDAKEIPADENNLLNHKNYFKLTVTDNGIGFNQKYAGKIFEIFQRLHNKEEFSGTGIGLAICKRIVQNHNGAIYANSKENEGTTITVCLPVHEAI